MGDTKHASWMGSEYLHQLNGMSSEASPVRAIFLAHRVAASGRLWMTQGVNIRSIDFREGAIVGCSGFTSLLEDGAGDRSWSVDDWAQAFADSGTPEVDCLCSVGVALCRDAIAVEDAGDWMVNFVSAQSGTDDGSGDGIDTWDVLRQAIVDVVSDDDVRIWLEGVATSGVETIEPSDAPAERWALPDSTQRLFSVASNISSVGALFVEVGAGGWSDLAQLWRLGMIQARTDPNVEEPQVEPPPLEPDPVASSPSPPNDPAPPPDPTPPPAAARPASSRKRRPAAEGSSTEGPSRKRDDTAGKKRRKRKRDPRIVAIMRAPYENPSTMEATLREAYDLLTRMRPEVIFRIRKSDDLDLEKIERRYLDACSRYHPDRYRGADQGVQSLAEGCFTAVSDAFHRLKVDEYQHELRIRLVEKETGKRVVTDKTRVAAKVEFAKADVLFKQKRYEAAYELASRAAEGDPDRWQYQFLKWRTAYRTGAAGVDEVRNEIGALSGMNSIEKGSALYTVGEMYMREGQEKKAFELFRQTLTLDDKNVGARRRLRLKGRREQEASERETTGLFGGLFQRRKR